jgi:DNA-binding CsgD family transcriptional regulator
MWATRTSVEPLAMPANGEAKLTPRELEVATLLAYGHTNGEIATRLTISIRTAEMHRANALRKLNAPSRAHVVRWALDNGILR